MEQIILLSSPRSGNTWLRYIIEYMFHIRTIGYGGNPIDVAPLLFVLNRFIDYRDDRIVIKRHHGLEGFKGREKLIYIQRDIARLDIENRPRYLKEKYKENEIAFNSWIGEKIKIDYKELKEEPNKVINELKRFFLLDGKNEDFELNIEQHIKNSITIYCEIGKEPSKTYGRNI